MSRNEREYEVSAIADVEFDSGVRSTPPEGWYAPTVRFDENSDESWSIGMKLSQDRDDDVWTKRAQIDFVADEAPHDRLIRGAEFDIYEGPYRVGRIRVITPSNRIPEEGTEDRSFDDNRPRKEKDAA